MQNPKPKLTPPSPPDPALAAHAAAYSDPDLQADTDEIATDLLEEVMPVMPLVIPAMGVLQIVMFAFVAVYMA
jgi:hypothetical protein